MDDNAHKKHNQELRAKRKEQKRHKSASRREKEAKVKEHQQRFITKSNKKSRSSAKPPPPSDAPSGSKFQALFAKRSEGFIIDMSFRNTAPRPPVGPCFVGLGVEGELNDKWTKYKPFNAVESNYSWKLHAEPNLGVPLAPSAMDLEGCYEDPTKKKKKQKDDYNQLFDEDEPDPQPVADSPPPLPTLHADDEAIINWKGYAGDTAAEELQRRRDRARAEARAGMYGAKTPSSNVNSKQISLTKRKIKSRVLNENIPSFMKKTTYLSNDQSQSVHAFKSLAETKALAAVEINRKLKDAHEMSGEDAIEQSFEIVNKFRNDSTNTNKRKRIHPTKKDVYAVEEIDLLPDDVTWSHTFTHVVLDKLPKVDTSRPLIKMAQLEKAYITDVGEGSQNKMKCNLLIADENNKDDENTYNAIQKYDLDILPLKEENAPHTYFLFIIDEENGVATYHPISSRVQLSTGRPIKKNKPISRSITKRPMNDHDVEKMERSLAEVDADLAKKYDSGDEDRGTGGGHGYVHGHGHDGSSNNNSRIANSETYDSDDEGF